MDLSILCVTRLDPHATAFLHQMRRVAVMTGAELVIAVDGDGVLPPIGATTRVIAVESAGYIESVLDEAVDACSGDYVLRLDDDERVSENMLAWLCRKLYRAADHWAFPRMHLWPDEKTYIANPPLWRDLQTRLSVKPKAGGRTAIHQGSPYGTGRVAPDDIAIEHHKFIVRDRAAREDLLEHYGRLIPDADRWAEFSVPELFANIVTIPR